ncbi:metallopeptidase TldD-related protein [Tumebacillus flagellatus]|uniref:Metalloprotease TldD/E C-terminal domain-containing protein n=1 Tax=Tumebacillus flagellatus TaxID=1157490 RepID=A0A074LP67_9BACL|nr:metallopeptidase TldD-related protein [Tumebacillus flagellatus]KEO83961.1 hypothetical protein EL26_07175 [Tumebacillus flagellatus]
MTIPADNKYLRDLLENKKQYFAEIIWKEGQTLHVDPSQAEFPVVPIIHQGGLLILSDGAHQGRSTFQEPSEFTFAYEQAREMLLTRTNPIHVGSVSHHSTCGTFDPVENEVFNQEYIEKLKRDIKALDEYHQHLHGRFEGRHVVKAIIDRQYTQYLNSNGTTLSRNELFSTVASEILTSANHLYLHHSVKPQPIPQHLQELNSLELYHEEGEASEFASGNYPCMMSSHVAGVFLHEVVGHLFEADTAIASKLYSKKGSRIAPDFVHISDKPNMQFDDEGSLTQNTFMIQNGRIEGLLHSRETAARDKVQVTGHGRAIRGGMEPMPRMHCTCMEPGVESSNTLKSAFKRMVYLESIEDAHSHLNNFVLQIRNAHVLDNGVPVQRIGRCFVRGSCLSALSRIVSISNQAKKHFFTCSKKNQNGLYVASDVPEILIDSIWIGKG